MENHHRGEKDRHEHRSKKPYHSDQKHHNSRGKGEQRRPRRIHLDQREIRHPRERLSTAPALSGDDDYVRRWLADAEAETRQEREDYNQPSEVSAKRNNEHRSHDDGLKGQQAHLLDHELERRRRRRHGPSSDSSLLGSPPKKRTRRMDFQEPSPRKPSIELPKRRHQTQRHESREPEPQLSSEPPSIPASEVFHKRPRHKTREDRYEPKVAGKSQQKDDRAKQKRAKKTSKGRQKTLRRKTGGELMNDFTSDKISNERLTMRPSNGPGLFMNGRASSPVRRRGVPDLTFSEMDFLQHAYRYQHIPAECRVKSKSRENERRTELRVPNEIPTFSQANGAPLKDVESNKQYTFPLTTKVPYSYNRKRNEEDGEEPRMKLHQIKSGKSTEYPYLDFGQPGLLSEIPACSIPGASKNPAMAMGVSSEQATSYVSWSETQCSPDAMATRKRHANVEEARKSHSTTPESIRRLIEETRIFCNTGIQASSSSKRQTKARDMDPRGGSHKDQRPSKDNTPSKLYDSSTDSSTNFKVFAAVGSATNSTDQLSTANERPDSERALMGQQVEQEQEYSVQELEESTRTGTTKNVTVEHFDKKHGWHQLRSPTMKISQASASMSKVVQRTTSAPMNREQIAKHVRIKMPLKAVPWAHTSTPSLLQTIPETEVEIQQEYDPKASFRNALHENLANTSNSAEIASAWFKHLHPSSVRERTVSSMGSIATSYLSHRSTSGFQLPGSARMTPLAQEAQNFQLPRELDSKTSNLSGLHSLGLPIRGGSGERTSRPLPTPTRSFYVNQITQHELNEEPDDHGELGYCARMEENLETPETYQLTHVGDMQYDNLDNEQYGSLVNEDGSEFVIREEIEEGQKYQCQNIYEPHDNYAPHILQQNADDPYHQTHNDQNEDDEDIEAGYVDNDGEFGRETYPLGPQNQDVMGFWQPRWQY